MQQHSRSRSLRPVKLRSGSWRNIQIVFNFTERLSCIFSDLAHLQSALSTFAIENGAI